MACNIGNIYNMFFFVFYYIRQCFCKVVEDVVYIDIYYFQLFFYMYVFYVVEWYDISVVYQYIVGIEGFICFLDEVFDIFVFCYVCFDS